MIAALLLATLSQEPVPAEGIAFIALSVPRRVVLVNEPVEVALRFGFDLEEFEERLVQPFRQPLDVPASVTAAGWGAWEGTLPRALPEGEPADERFVLNDERATARRLADALHDGRRVAVFEVVSGFVPLEPGRVELPAPELTFVTTSGFEEDFLGERRPLDRVQRAVRGEPLSLEVRAWPEEDRPAHFTGAVGRFSLRAEAEPRVLAVGEVLRLTLAIEGEGNLENLEPPALDALPGLHLLGRLVDRNPERVSATYDLRVLDTTVREVPAIPYAYLEPGPAPRYTTAATAPLELEVTGDTTGGGAEYGPPGGATIPDRGDGAEPSAGPAPGDDPPLLPWILVLLGPLGFWLGYRFRGRNAPAAGGSTQATKVFERRSPAPAADPGTRSEPTPAASEPLQRLAERLADRLGVSTPSVFDAGLEARLARAGAPQELARRAAGLFEAATAARYGGAALPDADAGLEALLADLERAWPRGVSGTSPPAPR